MGKELVTLIIEIDEDSPYHRNIGTGDLEELLIFHGITVVEIKESTVVEDDFDEEEED
jgi:hypothetical protein